jgi:hypothetical protein
MKLLDIPLGLIIHFHALKLTEGVSGLILPGAKLASVRQVHGRAVPMISLWSSGESPNGVAGKGVVSQPSKPFAGLRGVPPSA